MLSITNTGGSMPLVKNVMCILHRTIKQQFQLCTYANFCGKPQMFKQFLFSNLLRRVFHLPNNSFFFRGQTKEIKHSSGLCLDTSEKARDEPSVKPCNGHISQQWELKNMTWNSPQNVQFILMSQVILYFDTDEFLRYQRRWKGWSRFNLSWS